jgi:hypothetical protein
VLPYATFGRSIFPSSSLSLSFCAIAVSDHLYTYDTCDVSIVVVKTRGRTKREGNEMRRAVDLSKVPSPFSLSPPLSPLSPSPLYPPYTLFTVSITLSLSLSR